MSSRDLDYDAAFARNLGLISRAEQGCLRKSTVAIVGAGGVGGGHALTLARMGVGAFRIVDPDTFEPANFNRQFGAFVSTLHKPKADSIAKMVNDVNPDARVSVWNEALDVDNVDEILRGVSVVLDGLDFFAVDARCTMYDACRRHGIPVVASGPIGMSTTMHVFMPDGISFRDYFDIREGMSRIEKLAAFLVGVAPRMSQRSYMDMAYANIAAEYGPSLSAACALCAGVAGIEALRILLQRPGLRAAPHFYQFDAYKQRLYSGVLRFGNRGPMQILKRRAVLRAFAAKPDERGVAGQPLPSAGAS